MKKIIKTSNQKCSEYVSKFVDFKANNVFSESIIYGVINKELCYAVYSYGHHFPLYVNKAGIWYENSDKYSVSTSKQQTQARPDTDTIKKTTSELKEIISDAKRLVSGGSAYL